MDFRFNKKLVTIFIILIALALPVFAQANPDPNANPNSQWNNGHNGESNQNNSRDFINVNRDGYVIEHSDDFYMEDVEDDFAAIAPFSMGPSVIYQAHVQGVGWQSTRANGTTAGTTYQSLRMEALRIHLSNAVAGSGIRYRSHVQGVGWQNWVSNNAISGTTGQSLRIEAVQIYLTGAIANTHLIEYRVHVQSIGWMPWVGGGHTAGTTGRSLRVEAIQIRLVPRTATLTLSPFTNWTNIPYTGASRTVTVTTNMPSFSVIRPTWMSHVVFTNGAIVLTAPRNNTLATRTGTVTVIAGGQSRSFNVSQQSSAIWHSDGSWVGFWPGTIRVHSQTIGRVSTGFRLGTWVGYSRAAWGNALGVTIHPSDNPQTAQIRVFGGLREEVERHRGDRVGSTDWTGIARHATRTRVGTITAGNAVRGVYRYSGQASMWVVQRSTATTWSQDNINRSRKTISHELGHTLGFHGHSPSNIDVMWHANTPHFTLQYRERRHLRQIYANFR